MPVRKALDTRKRGSTWQISANVAGRRIRISAGKGATREEAQQIEAKIRSDATADRLGTRYRCR